MLHKTTALGAGMTVGPKIPATRNPIKSVWAPGQAGYGTAQGGIAKGIGHRRHSPHRLRGPKSTLPLPLIRSFPAHLTTSFSLDLPYLV